MTLEATQYRGLNRSSEGSGGEARSDDQICQSLDVNGGVTSGSKDTGDGMVKEVT